MLAKFSDHRKKSIGILASTRRTANPSSVELVLAARARGQLEESVTSFLVTPTLTELVARFGLESKRK